MRLQYQFGLARDAVSPINKGAEDIEEKCFDAF